MQFWFKKMSAYKSFFFWLSDFGRWSRREINITYVKFFNIINFIDQNNQ